MSYDMDNYASQDARNVALLVWVGSLFFNFIPGLLLYLLKKDDPYLQDHAKESLNVSITMLLGYLVSGLLAIILIGFLAAAVVALCDFVFRVMGAVAASNGKKFRAPFALRLIK